MLLDLSLVVLIDLSRALADLLVDSQDARPTTVALLCYLALWYALCTV